MPAAAVAAGAGAAGRRWRQDGFVAALALALLLAWDGSGADLALTRLVAGPEGFPWREHWLTSRVLHQGGRMLAWALFALLVLNIWQPLIRGPSKPERIRWALLTLTCAVVVPAFKQLSTTSCPWDLAEFGGLAPYVAHWRLGVADGGPGRCFPSGHAVSAFAFLSGWFVLRRQRPHAARWWLGAVLAAGLVLGAGQLARGAHFASHTLWTAWWCWLLCWLLCWLTTAHTERH